MFSFSCSEAGQSLSSAMALSMALSMALAQGKNQEELARLAAFFTLVGDTLALLSLQSSSDCGKDQAVTSPDSP